MPHPEVSRRVVLRAGSQTSQVFPLCVWVSLSAMMKVLLVIILSIKTIFAVYGVNGKDYNTVDSVDGNGITKMGNEESKDREAQQLLAMTQLIKTVTRLVKDVEDLKTSKKQKKTIMELETKFDGLTNEINALKTSSQEQEKMSWDITHALKTMSTRGKWCGKKREGYVSYFINQTLNYQWSSIDTNMELHGREWLNISTGNPYNNE